MKHKVLKGLAMAALTAVAVDAFAAKELRVATAAPQNTPGVSGSTALPLKSRSCLVAS